MAIRDSMRSSAAAYLRPGESVQAVIGARAAGQRLAARGGAFLFPGLNRYRIVAVTPDRIVVLDAGRLSPRKARGVVTELSRSTRLGPGAGLWHQVKAGQETLHVHRRFYPDLDFADFGYVIV
jgi:hypothetical protein